MTGDPNALKHYAYAVPMHLSGFGGAGRECSGTPDDEFPHACTAHADLVREMWGDPTEAIQQVLR